MLKTLYRFLALNATILTFLLTHVLINKGEQCYMKPKIPRSDLVLLEALLFLLRASFPSSGGGSFDLGIRHLQISFTLNFLPTVAHVSVFWLSPLRSESSRTAELPDGLIYNHGRI